MTTSFVDTWDGKSPITPEIVERLAQRLSRVGNPDAALRNDIGDPIEGVFDDRKLYLRCLYVRGVVVGCLSSAWVIGGRNVPLWARKPWSYFPDIPRKLT